MLSQPHARRQKILVDVQLQDTAEDLDDWRNAAFFLLIFFFKIFRHIEFLDVYISIKYR